MAVVTMNQLLEAGVQFGHQTRRWNPKMRRFIHGDRAGIHIVDLRQTLARLEQAYVFVRDLVADGGTVLFVGTKKQAQDSVQSYAERCNMPYVNERWQGGMLTNFHTIAKRIAKMKDYQRMRDSGEFEAMPKKEALLLGRELDKLERNLGGIRDMQETPGAVFILDTKKEHIAVTEARKLGVPIVAVVDTNCDPDLVDYAIPGNDDAIRSGRLMARVISDAVQEGRFIHSKRHEAAAARDALAEAEAVREQSRARAEAAAAAAEREARMAAAKATAPDASDAASAPASGGGAQGALASGGGAQGALASGGGVQGASGGGAQGASGGGVQGASGGGVQGALASGGGAQGAVGGGVQGASGGGVQGASGGGVQGASGGGAHGASGGDGMGDDGRVGSVVSGAVEGPGDPTAATAAQAPVPGVASVAHAPGDTAAPMVDSAGQVLAGSDRED